jgi:SWIM zinc finger
MTTLTVRIRNSMYQYRDRYSYFIPEFVDYTGEVVPNPPWVSSDSFCLTTGDPSWPFRILSKDDIVCGWKHSGSSLKKESKVQSYIVKGSKSSYVVTIDENNKASCNCTGFAYRKNCSHVKEVLSRRDALSRRPDAG